ncbi:MAG: ribosome biogenesis GTPase Der [Chloroflexi bacterium]|nr:ribosome biogenesis GTPase Der [Chloroflexota bacterium]
MRAPVVALVGRPNVGKSTLFNRVMGQRLAIVEDLPGTTRDRIAADVTWDDHVVTLVDTGGLEIHPNASLTQQVQEQVEAAIAEADVIVFVVDARDGVVTADQEVADVLRRSGKPVVLAANKADNPQRELQAVEFYAYGLGEPVPISAHHGTGIGDLFDRVLALAPAAPPPTAVDEEQAREAEEAVVDIAIVGRPNVGKSALMNAILGEERVIVSPLPGTTRDAIDTTFQWRDQPLVLIDTAGMRRRGRITGGIEYYSVLRSVRAIQRADVALLVLDATEGVTAQDTHVAGYIQDEAKGLVVVANKWDLVPQPDTEHFTRLVREHLKFIPNAPIVFTSATLGRGVEPVLAAAVAVYQERAKRVGTGTLNQILAEALAAHSPPSKKGRQLKIYYATQVAVHPPTFVFFVNDRELVHFSYQRYLENRLRAALGFVGTPVRMFFRSSHTRND